MPQPWGLLDKEQRHVVFGVPGTGKTTLLRRLTADAWRCIWWDPEGDFMAPGRRDLTPQELMKWPGFLDHGHCRLVIVDGDQEDFAALLWFLIDRYNESHPGNLVVAADELGDERGPITEKAQNRFYGKCRKRGLVPVFASQIVTDIAYGARKVASDVWITQQTHIDELKEIRRVWGPEVEQRAANWKPWEITHYRPGKGIEEL